MENDPVVRFGGVGEVTQADPLLKVRESSARESARKAPLAALFSKPVSQRISELEGYSKDAAKVQPMRRERW